MQELPFVEAVGVLQQGGQLGDDDVLTECILVVVVFYGDVFRDGFQLPFFPGGKVQGLVRGVGEEAVLADPPGQFGPLQKVFVEIDRKAALLEDRAAVPLQDLPRGDEDQRAVGEVVLRPAVIQIALHALLEADGIAVVRDRGRAFPGAGEGIRSRGGQYAQHRMLGRGEPEVVEVGREGAKVFHPNLWYCSPPAPTAGSNR